MTPYVGSPAMTALEWIGATGLGIILFLVIIYIFFLFVG